MENKATTVENLFEKVEQFSTTSFELYKHKAIYEIALLTSTLAVRYILTIVIALFFFFISIGSAIWIGDVTNKNYYGYFIVALVYSVVGILIYVFRKPWIKVQISNLVRKSMLNTQ
jgi:hypothetical protein